MKYSKEDAMQEYYGGYQNNAPARKKADEAQPVKPKTYRRALTEQEVKAFQRQPDCVIEGCKHIGEHKETEGRLCHFHWREKIWNDRVSSGEVNQDIPKFANYKTVARLLSKFNTTTQGG